MSAFAVAINAIFADRNVALDARWFAGGAGDGVPVRVVRRAPDQLAEFNGARIVADSVLLDVRVSEVAALARGDRIVIGDVAYEILGEPRRDAERLVWKGEARAL
ncbi:head-tail joining protein [Paracoccus litorisediminis]|uniref:Head-tail adaptor protein n=1 Tax=Paracoccus litorisediminis TaxID=2006130 RepID=A0A844HQI5_9RHOB|nr:hypothetical protein [Paracoccus litorisediminis]MTH62106.1 hypothetical protein [Paracoccus litorisediminis]